jgi:prepilin-type N-terminal cleavage/methylation domain-containing protein
MNLLKSKGFTLVELMVSVGIFVFMTALVVAKYGNFNQSVLLTDLAYDVALTIRTAQTYGLSVGRAYDTGSDTSFQYYYGVHFDNSAGNNQNIILYAVPVSTSGNPPTYDQLGVVDIANYSIKRGAKILNACMGNDENDCSTANGKVDIVFKRPDPTAVICSQASCNNVFVMIELQAVDGSTRAVMVYENGQIKVGEIPAPS